MGKLKVGNETLKDQLAVLVGTIGENLLLKRAFCFETTNDDIEVAYSIHPPCQNSDVLIGINIFILFILINIIQAYCKY